MEDSSNHALSFVGTQKDQTVCFCFVGHLNKCIPQEPKIAGGSISRPSISYLDSRGFQWSYFWMVTFFICLEWATTRQRKRRTTGRDVLPMPTQQWNLTLLANMGWGGGWGGMTGNDWTVQFGCWGKSEWKNLTGTAHSAANPESHKYERVPWEVGHVKTKVPGSGQRRDVEGGEERERTVEV